MVENNDKRGVIIRNITIEPDRWGRLYPVIHYAESRHPAQITKKTALESFAELDKRGYAVGDEVEIRTIGTAKFPRLGAIIRKEDPDKRVPFKHTLSECPNCKSLLVMKDGVAACPDHDCTKTVFSRARYACDENILDLPFGEEMLKRLIWGRRSLNSVTGLMFLDEHDLNAIDFDPAIDRDGGSRYGHDTEIALEMLQQRRNELFGYKCPPEATYRTQRNVLDALSLDGLYPWNIRNLMRSIYKKEWYWPDLPYILSKPADLRNTGVHIKDIYKIVRAAANRHREIEQIAREF